MTAGLLCDGRPTLPVFQPWKKVALPTRKSMMPSSESQRNLEAVRLTVIFLKKATTRMGTWRVWTMYKTGKMAQVAAEMHSYKLRMLGIAKTRWRNRKREDWRQVRCYCIRGMKKDDCPHTSGVVLMLSKSAKKTLVGKLTSSVCQGGLDDLSKMSVQQGACTAPDHHLIGGPRLKLKRVFSGEEGEEGSGEL